MKVIEVEKTIKEVTGYTANDGTFFRDKEECEKYEKSAKGVIKERFKKLIIKTFLDDDVYEAPYRLFGYGYNDTTIGIIKLKTKEDVDTANMYIDIATSDQEVNRFTDDMINEEIYVMIECCGEDRAWIYGTEGEVISNFIDSIRFAKGDKEYKEEIKENRKDYYRVNKED